MGDLIIEVCDPNQGLRMILEVTGNLGLDNLDLDLTGKLTFFEDFKYYPELVKYFPEQDGKGMIPFPIPIGGTLLRPEFNLASLQTSLVRFSADLTIQREIRSGLERILKKKEKKVEQGSEQQLLLEPEEKPPTRKKPENILEDISKGILDQIFNKKR